MLKQSSSENNIKYSSVVTPSPSWSFPCTSRTAYLLQRDNISHKGGAAVDVLEHCQQVQGGVHSSVVRHRGEDLALGLYSLLGRLAGVIITAIIISEVGSVD